MLDIWEQQNSNQSIFNSITDIILRTLSKLELFVFLIVFLWTIFFC